ncbi:hypothetical protein ACFO1B_18390 [Dactylosporangium siamense]|uniref:Uncharacterized protein n=1 Tax=Dactylosporangium siamense TaxID=685454 RepID=A0A919PFF7_9ACTN|nr:hypothetical protein [Dactylosporangium siamense]GIG43845.1 hypothetical protein Dsi01nite_018860 [Dactylosporangium siamense]
MRTIGTLVAVTVAAALRAGCVAVEAAVVTVPALLLDATLGAGPALVRGE